MTAIVLMVADALVVGLPAEVAVTAEVLDVPSVAPAGAATFTQKVAVAPATIEVVVLVGVVQVAS